MENFKNNQQQNKKRMEELLHSSGQKEFTETVYLVLSSLSSFNKDVAKQFKSNNEDFILIKNELKEINKNLTAKHELSMIMSGNLSKITTLNLSLQNQAKELQLLINDLEKRVSYLEVKVS